MKNPFTFDNSITFSFQWPSSPSTSYSVHFHCMSPNRISMFDFSKFHESLCMTYWKSIGEEKNTTLLNQMVKISKEIKMNLVHIEINRLPLQPCFRNIKIQSIDWNVNTPSEYVHSSQIGLFICHAMMTIALHLIKANISCMIGMSTIQTDQPIQK